MRRLFVSYARENKADVDQLVDHLRTMGYDTWVDAALRGGQDWWDEILDRIADADAVLAIYSAAAMNSTACRREFDWATALGKPVIPVAVEPPPTALPSRFARRQIVDYSQPAQRDRAALLLQGALASLPPPPSPPDPLPEPPAAPLSYLTDLIDLITDPGTLEHDHQHRILRELEPALTSVDPQERWGGRDLLERLSTRRDLYADADRAISRLRDLSDQSAHSPGPNVLRENAVEPTDDAPGAETTAAPRRASTPSDPPTDRSADTREDVGADDPSRRRKALLVVASLAAVAVIGLAGHVLGWFSSSDAARESGPMAQIQKLLPTDVGCSPEPSTYRPGQIADAQCENTSQRSLLYELYRDRADLHKRFNDPSIETRPCPGGAPGPQDWARGKVECSLDAGHPSIQWTVDSDLLFGWSTANSDTLDELYRWWTAHYH